MPDEDATPEKTYTEEDYQKAINDTRIVERFTAWVVMANYGLPAEALPKFYNEAREIVASMARAKLDPVMKERFEGYLAMAILGISPVKIPENYLKARDLIVTVVNAPKQKKPAETEPLTPPEQ